MTLTGFGLVHDILRAGVLLILYGLGLLVMAIVAIVQLRSPVIRSPRRPLSDFGFTVREMFSRRRGRRRRGR